MERGMAVPGYRQAGTPVRYLTSGNAVTASRAAPPPSNARLLIFASHDGLKSASSRMMAAPSVRKAKMGSRWKRRRRQRSKLSLDFAPVMPRACAFWMRFLYKMSLPIPTIASVETKRFLLVWLVTKWEKPAFVQAWV